MLADNTTICCIADSADVAVAQLDKASDGAYRWCLKNRLTPHPGKREAMLMSKETTWGPLALVRLGGSILKWLYFFILFLINRTITIFLNKFQYEKKKVF